MNRHLLFFYGTLMSTDSRGHVLRDRDTNVGVIDLAVPVAKGTIRGDLFDVGWFPAVVNGDGEVHGEVWEAPSEAHLRAALGVTDQIEGYREGDPRSLYLRVEVPLLTVNDNRRAQPGDTVTTYLWNGSTARLTPMPDGRWSRADRGAFA